MNFYNKCHKLRDSLLITKETSDYKGSLSFGIVILIGNLLFMHYIKIYKRKFKNTFIF